jgi:hypothetical protein
MEAMRLLASMYQSGRMYNVWQRARGERYGYGLKKRAEVLSREGK